MKTVPSGSSKKEKDKDIGSNRNPVSLSKNSKPSKTKHKERSSSPQVQKPTDSKRIQNPSGSQSKTKGKAPPVANFNDLLKIAQSNSKVTLKDGAVKPNKSITIDDTKTKGSSSPVGKLLLERTTQRSKNKHNVEANIVSETSRSSGSSSMVNSKSKAVLSPTKTSDLIRRPLRDSSSGPTVTAKAAHSGESSNAVCGNGRTNVQTSTTGTKLPRSSSTTESQASVRGFKTPSVPLSLSQKQQQQRERLKAAVAAKMRSNQAPRNKTLNATAFYGAAAARILGKDGRFSGSRYAPSKYTSSWVDEMSDFLRSEDNFMNGDEEDEDDLDDFLDDDFIDDSGDGNDYSSTIREIFGYDKRR